MDTWRGESANAIYQSIKGTAVGIRRTDFLALRRQVMKIGLRSKQFEGLRADSLVPRAWMNTDPGVKTSLKTQYRFIVPTLDLETGEITVETRAIASNQHYTKEEAEAAMWDHLEGDMSKYKKEFLGIDLDDVWVRPDAILERGYV